MFLILVKNQLIWYKNHPWMHGFDEGHFFAYPPSRTLCVVYPSHDCYPGGMSLLSNFVNICWNTQVGFKNIVNKPTIVLFSTFSLMFWSPFQVHLQPMQQKKKLVCKVSVIPSFVVIARYWYCLHILQYSVKLFVMFFDVFWGNKVK